MASTKQSALPPTRTKSCEIPPTSRSRARPAPPRNSARFTRSRKPRPTGKNPARFTPQQEANSHGLTRSKDSSLRVGPKYCRRADVEPRPNAGQASPRSKKQSSPPPRPKIRPGSPHSKKQTPTGSPGQRIRHSESVQSTARVPIWNPAPTTASVNPCHPERASAFVASAGVASNKSAARRIPLTFVPSAPHFSLALSLAA